jgi:hypothetical protein
MIDEFKPVHKSGYSKKINEMVSIIDDRCKDEEVKRMGFPSIFLEAIENSIKKLVEEEVNRAKKEAIKETFGKIFVDNDIIPNQVIIMNKDDYKRNKKMLGLY